MSALSRHVILSEAKDLSISTLSGTEMGLIEVNTPCAFS